MAKEWCIEKKGGNEWLALGGWVRDLRMSLQFRSQTDAEAYMRERKVQDEAAAVQEEFGDFRLARAGIETEYNPYGPNT